VNDESAALDAAADAVANADALVVATGAGMGVDSGLPDFRGNEGFWRAYPAMRRLGISFMQMANPDWFDRDAALAWGFYGHRLQLYRATQPHGGFGILLAWGKRLSAGYFVFTSNVDGQHQRAGFDESRIVECHGSLQHLQCTNCTAEPRIWAADQTQLSVDEATFRAAPPLPECPECGALARPNVLMFGDWDWVPSRTAAQERRFEAWLRTLAGRRLVIVEIGAGSAVPTVRHTAERLASTLDGRLLRINPREPAVPRGQIGIAAPARDTLQAIQDRLPEEWLSHG
jgi:NAD-dependent SIR2 family protein deacetylase